MNVFWLSLLARRLGQAVRKPQILAVVSIITLFLEES